MAAGENGSDIQLLAGLQGGGSISGASGKRIQNELTNIINRINKNPAGVKLTLSKNGETQLKESIAQVVSSVEIKSFNSTAAIAKLKSDIQAAVNGVAIPTPNTGSTTGGGSRRGFSKGRSPIDGGAFKARYPEFGVRTSGLSAEYAKMVKGDAAGGSTDLANYTKRYSELLIKIEEARVTGRIVNNDTVTGLKSEIILLENEIKLLNEKAAVQRNVTAAGASFETQYPEFGVRASELSSAYQKMIKTASNADGADALKTKYQELLATVNKLRSAGEAASKEDVAHAQTRMVDLTNEINKINEVAAAEQRAAKAKDSFNVQYPEFGVRASELSSAYQKMIKTASNADGADALKTKYQELLATVNKLRSAGEAASKEDVAHAQTRMVDLTNEINKINEVAAAEQRAAKAKETFASASQVNTLAKKAQSLLDNNPRITNTGYGENLRKVLSDLQSGAKLSTEEFEKLKASVLSVESGIKSAGLQGKTLWSVLKAGYQKFGGWALITKSMMAAANSVRQMITNVTNLDAAMTELRKVTDETDATYEQFFSEATVRARKLGATVTDTINASADFARLGYDIDDAATLADTAIMYKNVGDGITDISVASQSIISTLKGFSLEAEDATHVIDAFNEVGKYLCPAA